MAPPDSWINLTLHALATYRLALMVSKEAGPGWLFKYFRREVKKRAPKASHMDEGITCLWCMSMQIAILISILRELFSGILVYDTSIYALAISAVAVVLNQAFTKG